MIKTETKTNNPEFLAYDFNFGVLADFSDDQYPTILRAWTGCEILQLGDEGTHFGYVFDGKASLMTDNGSFWLNTGSYFAIPHPLQIAAGNGERGKGIIITRLGYKALRQVGGPIENWGRLRYIDGCTDSLLIPPVLKGDACLNALYFPPGIDQTMHTHPSIRVGIVANGRGTCVTPHGNISLHPGQIFIIPTDAKHKFRTDKGESMTIIAYHPDSDFGAEHENHPMINRTIVDGVSASQLREIQTKDRDLTYA